MGRSLHRDKLNILFSHKKPPLKFQWILPEIFNSRLLLLCSPSLEPGEKPEKKKWGDFVQRWTMNKILKRPLFLTTLANERLSSLKDYPFPLMYCHLPSDGFHHQLHGRHDETLVESLSDEMSRNTITILCWVRSNAAVELLDGISPRRISRYPSTFYPSCAMPQGHSLLVNWIFRR